MYHDDAKCHDTYRDLLTYSQGYLATIQQCYQACKFVSNMFSYGKNSSDVRDADRCNSTGCHCVCDALGNFGRCDTTTDYGYAVYTDVGKSSVCFAEIIKKHSKGTLYVK